MTEGLKPCPFRQVNQEGQILCQLIKGTDREITLDICRACPAAQINCQHLRASLEKQVGTSLTVRFLGGRTEVWNDNPPAVSFKRAACAEKAMPIHSPRDCAGCPIRAPQVIPSGLIVQRQLTTAVSAASPAPAAVATMEPVRQTKRARAQAAQPAAVQPMPTQERRKQVRPAAESRVTPRGADETPVSVATRQTVSAPARVPERQSPPSNAEKSGAAHAAENPSKIILLQQWLAAQTKKKGEIQDPDIVRDIPARQVSRRYVPTLAPEEGTEKCVGWTD